MADADCPVGGTLSLHNFGQHGRQGRDQSGVDRSVEVTGPPRYSVPPSRDDVDSLAGPLERYVGHLLSGDLLDSFED